jgi:hypothetical protein
VEAVMKGYKLTGSGFVLLLAPLYFVSASILKHGLGIGLYSALWIGLSCPIRKVRFGEVARF